MTRLLVVRNDKLGDFMLAWSAFALLKQRWPQLHLVALVPSYTAAMAELCPWIDELLLDEGEGAVALARKMRGHNFDAMLTLFSTTRVAMAGWLARIPYRLAPATKLAQLLYNHRLVQRRSRSEKPEYAYNLDLAKFLLADVLGDEYSTGSLQDNDHLPASIPRPLLNLERESSTWREQLCEKLQLPTEARLIFIHPGSGGSANNLTAAQYIQLANLLECNACAFVVTAGPGEEPAAQSVVDGISARAALYTSTEGLSGFVQALQCADLFISNSTGPLHIAAALNRPTAAFYPRHRSATPLRWQTLNAPERRLAFVPPAEALAEDVSAIDIKAAAKSINQRFLQTPS